MTALSEADFWFVANEAKNRSGLVLTLEKSYLVETRLTPIVRREGFASLRELIAAARTRRDERLIAQFVDALTTNETFFFRDKTPFDLFREVIAPTFTKARAGGRMRIWCAAAATGQEPYSLAMTLLELREQGRGVDADILATDISDRVLEKARSGLYSQFEAQRGLPIQMLVKYFEKQGDLWRIADRVRSLVRFQQFNLLTDPRALGRFDVVFCRNVLIYFDADDKRRVLEGIAGSLNDGGAVILGAAETVTGITEALAPAPDRRALYLRNPAWRRAA